MSLHRAHCPACRFLGWPLLCADFLRKEALRSDRSERPLVVDFLISTEYESVIRLSDSLPTHSPSAAILDLCPASLSPPGTHKNHAEFFFSLQLRVTADLSLAPLPVATGALVSSARAVALTCVNTQEHRS